MVLDIEKALENAGAIFHADLCEKIDSENLPSDCEFAENVVLSVDYTITEDGLLIWGKLAASIKATCARCLNELIYPVEAELSEVYQELSSDEDEAYPYEGSLVNLDKMVIDQILLKLPVRFLCRENCKGLCPHCGKNLNDGGCNCEQGTEEIPANNPFSGLKGLFD